jgi:hypothetical protein
MHLMFSEHAPGSLKGDELYLGPFRHSESPEDHDLIYHGYVSKTYLPIEFRESVVDIASLVPPGPYRHHKGRRYTVIGVGFLVPQSKVVVAYIPRYETEPLVASIRPADNWLERVEADGYEQPRFERVRWEP